MAEAALAPYRVLDLTTQTAWPTGKILADLGAEVVKIEPLGGDPGRADNAAEWEFFCRGKQSVVLDLEDDGDRHSLLDLAAHADVVIESFAPGWLDTLGLGADHLLACNPRLVVTSVTPYGQTGPHAHWAASDLVLAARCGQAWLTGDEDRPPLRISVPQMHRHGAAEAAVHTVIALYHAARTGKGQHVDVATLLAGVRTLMNATPYPPLYGVDAARAGQYPSHSDARFRLIIPCLDGHVAMIVVGGHLGGKMMRYIFDWAAREFDVPAELRDIDFSELDFASLRTGDDARRFVNAVDAVFVELFAKYTKAELYEIAMDNLLLLAPVNTLDDLRCDEQLEARGYWTEVDGVIHAGPWCKPSATPLVNTARAPAVGADADRIV